MFKVYDPKNNEILFVGNQWQCETYLIVSERDDLKIAKIKEREAE